MLASVAPGRVDLGIGKSPGGLVGGEIQPTPPRSCSHPSGPSSCTHLRHHPRDHHRGDLGFSPWQSASGLGRLCGMFLRRNRAGRAWPDPAVDNAWGRWSASPLCPRRTANPTADRLPRSAGQAGHPAPHAAAPAISVAAKAYPATARTKRDGGRVEAHGIFKSSGNRPCCAMLPRPCPKATLESQQASSPLRRELYSELAPVARADWPAGVASGKYDTAIHNITVTEERKEKFDLHLSHRPAGLLCRR